MKQTASILLLCLVTALFAGCMESGPVTDPSATATLQTTPPTTQPALRPTMPTEGIRQEAQVLEHSAPAVQFHPTVEAPGTLEHRGSSMVIDYSNTEKGYIMVRCEEDTDRRLKVRIIGPTTTYTYNLPSLQWTAFPLSDENGHYKVVIYRNVVDTKYAAVLSLELDVALADPFGPFLRSNQYVDFDAAPNAVAQAAMLTTDLEDPLQKVAVIYDYVVTTLSYDKELAATVKSGYLPVLDQVLEKKSGICFDYAALLTGMLRSQGIPAKLVVGYAGDVYHAWISVWTESTGWIDGMIFFDGTAWNRMDPTFASSGQQSQEIMAYIADSAHYTAKYVY